MIRLKPSLTVRHVMDIPLEWLHAKGIQGFIFDLDNTLMLPQAGQLQPEVAHWLTAMQQSGYRCVVVSNNRLHHYIQEVEQVLGFPCIANAGKPRRAKLRQGLQLLNLPANQVVVVGDRPLTDIWGGQRLGTYTVLVDPLNRQHESSLIRSLRWLERCFIS